MKDSNELLNPSRQSEIDSKQHWNASLAYPKWPFGTVNPKELAKWGRKHTTTKPAIDDYEDAPL